MANQFRESLKQYIRLLKVLLVVSVVTVVLLVTVGCRNSSSRTSPNDKRPAGPMGDLLARYPSLVKSIQLKELESFVDTKCLWLVSNEFESVHQLILDEGLERADENHPKYKEMLRRLPQSWGKPNMKKASIYVTPGYGVEHQEGKDLLMMVVDPQLVKTFVLYEWVF